MKNKIIYLTLILIILSSLIYNFSSSNKISPVFNYNDKDTYLSDMYFNRYHGKSWITLGDSITKPNKYQNKLKTILNFSIVDNLGENGQTMASQSNKPSTYDAGKSIDYSKYDLATIFIGTNDFRYNKKLGKIKESGCNDFDENTFTGSYQLLIETILKSNSNIDLVLITPIQRVKDGYNIYYTNDNGSKLEDYVYAIKSLGKMYSLPVLDLYSESGITKETMDTFTKDGLHPNDAGYERISEKMYRFLLNI